jgi:GT2 family glycosyltransferase
MRQLIEATKTDCYADAILASNLSRKRLPFAASIQIPQILQRALPRPVMRGLRKLKVRILMSGLRRHIEGVQSPGDDLASDAISIIVPIHEAPAVTRRCLTSLEKYATKAEIILVDDGSRQQATRSMILEFINRNGWRLVNHKEPLGHSLACEAGVRISSRPYLCLLNSDTVVTPWCWRLVKEALEQDQNIAVVGPSTSHSGNLQALPAAHYLRNHLTDNQICGFAMRLLAESKNPIVMDLAWASGFAFFIRRSTWDQLGGFDRSLPDYGNEVELCKRVAARGYRRVWVRNAYIHHFGGQSYGETISAEAIAARKISTSIYIEKMDRSMTHGRDGSN